MEPLISIIVPVYNVENYLNQCVDSLINQTYKNLEIILINDGTLDKSGQICDDYKLIDSRIIVIHQENKGLSGARNSGLEIATGDYIGFVDSDDWVELDMFKTLVNFALKHELEVVECDIKTSMNNTTIDKNSLKLKVETTYQALNRIIKTTRFSVCTKLFKKSLIGNSKFHLGKTSEDLRFTIDLIPKVSKIGYYGFPFYNYRYNPESITKSTYNLTRLDDSLSAALYMKNELALFILNAERKIKQEDLLSIFHTFYLNKLIYHYKMLNYNPQIDPRYIHRKKIKNLIDKNYYNAKNHSISIKLAKILPIRAFELLINLNNLKHKVLKTNQI